jgi:large subunit ribosomal protein L14
MLQDGSIVKIADNSGGTVGKIFKVLGSAKRRYAGIGDVVVISIKTAQPRKRVFDKFFRSEDFRTRESSGTGLGLYVTMKLCKLINGTVTLESKLNEGSTFRIFVPDLKDKTLGTVDVRVQ